MQSPMPTFFGRATAVLGEHAHLHGTIEKLRTLSTNVAISPRERGSALCELLEGFESELRAHFSAEEAEGYFGMLTRERPEFLATIATLRAEHVEMLVSAHDLTLAALSGTAAEIQQKLEKLLERFEAHERVEVHILHDFLLDR